MGKAAIFCLALKRNEARSTELEVDRTVKN